ncbi:hypothetical protein K435DRAFT_839277 [Dendrothele bispora CBS 962.96]|uniref:Mid2 domain-containing protein n=1 Tax=Dendrothele bispora (strain CBS 962.96) TaxID=1314807 RepID=A0A4S8M1Z2_DENBC|nr:hypothetical protein K435DRAFT_839277 [Dendrothele bispora CBS 962.96]
MLGIFGVFLALSAFLDASVKALSISPFSTITQGKPLTITWQRDNSHDRHNWAFVQSGGERFSTVSVSDPEKSRGELPITFVDAVEFQLLAVHLNKPGETFATFTGITAIAASTQRPDFSQTSPAAASSSVIDPNATGNSSNGVSSLVTSERKRITRLAKERTITSSITNTNSLPTGVSDSSNNQPLPSTTPEKLPGTGTPTVTVTGPIPSHEEPGDPNRDRSSNSDLQNGENKTAIIVGTVLGGLVFILILAILILLCRRKRGRRNVLNMRFKGRRSWTTASSTTAIPFYRDMMVRSKSSGIGSGGTNRTNVNGERDVGSGSGGRFGLEESKVFMFGDVARRSSIDKGSYDDDDEEEGEGEVDERTPVLPSLLKNRAVAQVQDNTRLFQVKRKPPPPLVPLRSSKPDSPTATSLYTSSHGTTVTTSSSSSFISEESGEPPSTYLTDHRPRLRARTDRQMFLQEQIMISRREMISITNGSKDTRCGDGDGSLGRGGESAASQLAQLWERVRQLEEWQESDWALGLTNEEPKTGGMTIATVGLGALGDGAKGETSASSLTLESKV